MSLFQMFGVFEKYSFDVLFIAIIVVVVTSFIKRYIFKGKFKKVITLVPFIVGVGLQLLYQFIINKQNFLPELTSQVIKTGITCGGVGTVYYVFYEQFMRTKKLPLLDVPTLAVQGIISAIVVKDYVADTACQITQQISNRLHDKAYCTAVITDILSGKLQSGATNQDVITYSKLIITTLLAL